jgi:hypothetical protein
MHQIFAFFKDTGMGQMDVMTYSHSGKFILKSMKEQKFLRVEQTLLNE